MIKLAFSKNLIDANSYFSTYKSDLERPRSRFDRSSSIKTSFNVGDLVPFYLDEVLPGDTFDVETSFVTRLQTLITPPMDDLFSGYVLLLCSVQTLLDALERIYG